MYTLRLWIGSAIFAFGVAFWIWFFRNLFRPRHNRARLFVENPIIVPIIWNSVWVILGLWIYPVPHTIPLLALIIGLITGFQISK